MMEPTVTKVCSRCKVEKPITAFHRRRYLSGRMGRTSDCAACRVARRRALSKTDHGRERNRVNSAKHYHKMMAKAKISEFASESGEKLDMMRRALAEHPPELRSETETLAYFRGFISGAQRSCGESKRLESAKDLIHRIAAEEHKKHGRLLPYEDAISTGYEAVLEVIRSRRCSEDPAEFRKTAALAIRRRCIDFIRDHVGRDSQRLRLRLASNQDEEDGTIERLASPDFKEPDGTVMREALDSLQLLSDRDRKILQLLSEGLTLGRIGERVGLSESRVSQILREFRAAHPELEQRLLGA